jgi:hypothetical protein
MVFSGAGDERANMLDTAMEDNKLGMMRGVKEEI